MVVVTTTSSILSSSSTIRRLLLSSQKRRYIINSNTNSSSIKQAAAGNNNYYYLNQFSLLSTRREVSTTTTTTTNSCNDYIITNKKRQNNNNNSIAIVQQHHNNNQKRNLQLMKMISPQQVQEQIEIINKAPKKQEIQIEIDEIEELHINACYNNEKSYIDPKTGFTVFSEIFHLQRGKCCGNQCRHCPYGWENVKQKTTKIMNGVSKQHKVKSGDVIAIQQLLELYNDNNKNTATTNSKISTTIIKNGKNPNIMLKYENDNNNEKKQQQQQQQLEEKEKTTAATTTTNTTTTTTSTNNKKKMNKSKNKKKNVPYTRRGDKGTSQLFTGERRLKDDIVFEAMGTVDELCSLVGVVHAQLMHDINSESNNNKHNEQQKQQLQVLSEQLLDIMSRLFDIGSIIAKPPKVKKQSADESDYDSDVSDDSDSDCSENSSKQSKAPQILFDPIHIDEIESWINEMTNEMMELYNFILPTGTILSSQFHNARCVCRRTERRIVPLIHHHHQDAYYDDNILKYINRLSDYFFTAARYANHCTTGIDDIQYRQPRTIKRDNQKLEQEVHENDNGTKTKKHSQQQRIRYQPSSSSLSSK